MRRINYVLEDGLNDDELREVHQTALRIIDEVGVEVRSQEEVPTKELLATRWQRSLISRLA